MAAMARRYRNTTGSIICRMKGVTVVTDIPFEGRTIALQMQDIVDEMCDKYCRYPNEWDEEAEGLELSESDICANCPLNRLV